MKSKVITALLSVLIAFALWAYVVTVEAPESEETYFNIPVVLGNQAVLEERNLMIISQKDFKVDLTLSGYRTDLNKLDNTNITLLADLAQILEPGTHQLNYTVSYPGGNQSGTIHTVQKTPQQITLTVVERSQKEVPVKVAYTGTLPDGYTVDRQSVNLDHTTITVSGPKDVVDQIDQAKITVDLTNQNQTISDTYRHALCDANGEPIDDVSDVTVNVGVIRATVPIHMLKDVPLKLQVVPGGGLTVDMTTITMDRDTITLSGSEAALENLTEIVLGVIDLGTLNDSTVMIFDIVLPAGINNVTGVTSVSVDIKMPPMEIRKVAVRQFEPIHVPNGAQVEFLTEQILVEVRGPAQLLDKLQTENIVAIVDFSNAQPGNATYVATIEIRNTEGVGAIGGPYKVSATVQVLPDEPEDEV